MKTSLKKIKDCKMRLAVEVEAAQVESRRREVLGEFQKGANLPGFRQGKAPLDLVEKKFIKEIEEEVLKTLIPEVYHRAVLKHKTAPVALPAISEVKAERGKALSFTAEFEAEPEFSVKNYKGIKIKKVPVDVQEHDLEKGLNSLLESKAELVPPEEPRAVRQGDFILADIEIWQKGQYIPGKKGVLLAAEPNKTDDFCEKIVGAQLQESREITIEHSPEEKAKGLNGRKPLFKVWVRQIQEKKLPFLDDAFAKHFGQETVAELREHLRKDLARYKTSESQMQMKDELYEKLLSLVSLTVPEGLAEKQKERLLDQARTQYKRAGMPENRFEEDKARIQEEAKSKAGNQVKLYFILKKIADLEKIEVDELLLEQKLAALAEESKRPMDEVQRVFEEDLRESLREKATVDFLLANAKLEESSSR